MDCVEPLFQLSRLVSRRRRPCGALKIADEKNLLLRDVTGQFQQGIDLREATRQISQAMWELHLLDLRDHLPGLVSRRRDQDDPRNIRQPNQVEYVSRLYALD